MRRVFIHKLIPVLVLLCLLAVRGDTGSSGKSFLWEVQGKNNTVYLLGSIHVGTRDMYPLNPVIEKAFKKSPVAVFEVYPDGVPKDKKQKIMKKHIYYPKGESLKDHVSLKTYRMAKRKFRAYGLNLDALQKLRSWYLTFMLFYRHLERNGLQQSFGLDFHFMSRVKDKKVKTLESFDYHMSFFNELSDKTLEWNMIYTLKDLDKGGDEVALLLKSWRNGDLPEFERVMMLGFDGKPELKPLYNKMVIERNIAMTKEIKGYLSEDEGHFVVVGAGHLLGETGILSSLESDGYEVERK
ncbi:MAG: TraB/GumN family protein [Spirochaetota bacterium]|nr:TraB/GumN family protein [Spirochaetota bacterium]